MIKELRMTSWMCDEYCKKRSFIFSEYRAVKNVIRRAKRLAIDCWPFCKQFSPSREHNTFVNQLKDSSCSMVANYRVASGTLSN